MSTLRKLQREVIKNKCYRANGNTKNFKAEWDKVHSQRIESVDENGNVTTTLKKKGQARRKQHHDDNGKVLFKRLKMMKEMLGNLKKSKKTETVATTE